VFCGDAIADPLSGLHAALSVLAALVAGGGWLVDVAMAGVCADLARPTAAPAWPHVISPGRAGGADRGAVVGATGRARRAAVAGGEAGAGGEAMAGGQAGVDGEARAAGAAGTGWKVRHGEVTEPVRSW
jgi:hypothetical protein